MYLKGTYFWICPGASNLIIIQDEVDRMRAPIGQGWRIMRALNLHKARWRQLTVSLFTVFFSLAEKCSFSESSSSIFRLVTRKESDLQLCLDVKAARSWTKADQTRYGGCRKCAVSLTRVLAQFKLSTFSGTAPTVQNYPFFGFWKVLYLRTNSVVVGKI